MLQQVASQHDSPANVVARKDLANRPKYFWDRADLHLTKRRAMPILLRMQSAQEQLSDWMERRGLDQRSTAELLGMNETFVSKLMKGHRRPGLTNALKIQRMTGVSVEAWESSRLDTSDGRSRRTPAKSKRTKRQAADV